MDESWQTMFGNRHDYQKVLAAPDKIYRWLEYWKDEMQLLSEVKGGVIFIIAGDTPPFWAGDIRKNHGNDPHNVPALIEGSRFPEALELAPSQSFAGLFQVMDYLRMKYAPNVKLGYTLKTWGIAASSKLFTPPETKWATDPDMKIMADYINNFGIEFDILAFNFNPRSSGYTDEEYRIGARYFGEISKLLNSRDNIKPKLWIWKVSLWNQEHTSFYFQNIDYLVDSCNAIGMTLGHGNDLTKVSGFSDDAENENYVKSWMLEYYNSTVIDSISLHAVKGPVKWR
jgi:hypothetical protein